MTLSSAARKWMRVRLCKFRMPTGPIVITMLVATTQFIAAGFVFDADRNPLFRDIRLAQQASNPGGGGLPIIFDGSGNFGG
jgi:hypothetical protein